MAKTRDEFVAEIQPLIRDSTNNVVTVDDITASLNRCIRFLINKKGIYATKGRGPFLLFPYVYEYSLGSDVHDIAGFESFSLPREFEKRTPHEFKKRRRDEDDIFAIESENGVRFLLMKSGSAGAWQILDTCDSLTQDGTWAADATTDATNLTIDSVTATDGSSINFDVDVSLSATNTAAIQNSTKTAQSFASYEDVATLFCDAYVPDRTFVTGFTMRWGSSSSDYWEKSVTAQFSGLAVNNGWNRLGFDWGSAAETGTPNSAAITFVRFQVSFSASQPDDTDFRLDSLRFAIPESLEETYYSKNFVRDETTATLLKPAFATGGDMSLFELQDDDVFTYYAMTDADLIKGQYEDLKMFEKKMNDCVTSLEARYASEKKKESKRYY